MKTQFFTLAFLLLTLPVFSQVFVKSDASGANDGSSWANAYTLLTDALANAPADGEIWVAAGTYRAGDEGADPATTTFYFDKKMRLYGGFAGTETALDQRNIAANETILSGDISGDDIADDFVTNRGDNSLHVINMEFLAADGSVVDGFSIEGGAARYGDVPGGAEFTEWLGGGILSLASCEVRNCAFRQNGGGNGSAIFTLDGGTVTIENCVFENNDSETGTLRMTNHFQADVVYCHFENNHATNVGAAATVGNTNARFEDCTFLNNSAPEGSAGAMYIFQNVYTNALDPLVEFQNCVFEGNQATIAAALAFGNMLENSQLLMEDCQFIGNEAGGPLGIGGAIILQNSPGAGGAVPTDLQATIRRSSFENNTAVDAPGILAIAEAFDLNLVLDSCRFVSNVSQTNAAGLQLVSTADGFLAAELDHLIFTANTSGFAGGALYIANSNPDQPIACTLRNSIFEINSTQGLGGAIAINSEDATSIPGPIVTIERCDFFSNSAEGCCGAIFAEGSELQVRESDFSGNGTSGFLSGGGAIGLSRYRGTLIEGCNLLGNASGESDGAAIFLSQGQAPVLLDNVAMANNEGSSSLHNEDSLTLRNVTFFENEAGLLHLDGGHLTVQNCLFADDGPNLLSESEGTILSLGGNLSDDASMSAELTGNAGYADLNDTNPLLDNDLVPTMASPCIDAGNPTGIDPTATDAAGNARFQGSAIDIGAMESPFLVSPTFDPVLEAAVEVFPNPFVEVLNVQTEQPATALRLYDVHGRLVEISPAGQVGLPTGQTQITVGESLASGVYFLEMEFAAGTVRRMVVRQ